MVQLFDLDARVIRMPGARGRSRSEGDLREEPSLRETAERLLALPQPMDAPLARRLLRSGRPVLLQPGMADGRDAHRTSEPFLARVEAAVLRSPLRARPSAR
jgi:hypothetical protein